MECGQSLRSHWTTKGETWRRDYCCCFACQRFSQRSTLHTLRLIVSNVLTNFWKTWETTLRHLIELCDKRATGIHIDEIWALDIVNQGDSALVNKGKLGDVCEFAWLLKWSFFRNATPLSSSGLVMWDDNARDIQSFVENYIPAGPFVASETPLPVHLPRVPSDVSAARVAHGFTDRNFVAVGHSIGGASS